MTEREIFEKYDNLSEDELYEKSNKNVYVKNDLMSTVIKRCRSEKKEAKEKQMDLEKKLMISESEIPECPEQEFQSKIRNIFINEKILEECSIKDLILIFVSITKKKYKLTKIGVNTYYLELIFILLNIIKPEKLMKKTCQQRHYFWIEKIKSTRKKTWL